MGESESQLEKSKGRIQRKRQRDEEVEEGKKRQKKADEAERDRKLTLAAERALMGARDAEVMEMLSSESDSN